MNDYYPFVNTPLPYAYDALEPYIDEETMHLHHDRHLQTYIDNLNGFLEENPSLQNYSLEELLTMWCRLPCHLQTPLKNNAEGVYNHRFYFDGMKPSQRTKNSQNDSSNFGEVQKSQKHYTFERFYLGRYLLFLNIFSLPIPSTNLRLQDDGSINS